jgi:hypothetical protein
MQPRVKDLQIGQAFRLTDSIHIYIAVDAWHPLFGLKALILDFGVHCCFEGEEEVELITLLPVVLEQEDLETLDRLLLIEGEGESRPSRVTRLLEGAEGAIASQLSLFNVSFL